MCFELRIYNLKITPVEPREVHNNCTITKLSVLYVQLKIVHTIIHDKWQMCEAVEEAGPRERPQEEEPQEGEVSHRNNCLCSKAKTVACAILHSNLSLWLPIGKVQAYCTQHTNDVLTYYCCPSPNPYPVLIVCILPAIRTPTQTT